MRRVSLFFFLTLLLMAMLPLALKIQPVRAGTIIVPDDYGTIQGAINAASHGDTVFVRNGTYPEHVVVNITVSLIGEDKQTTIIDCEEHKGVVKVLANDVTIQNFTIRNSNNDPFDPPDERYSILVESNNTLIKNNLIAHNTFSRLWYRGISLFQAYNNTIIGNIMVDFPWECIGIFLLQSSNNTIVNNNMTLAGVGIWMEESSNNIFYENIMVGNWYNGIICQLSSHHNNFTDNIITGTNGEGIWLAGSQNGVVVRNTLANNGVGVGLIYSNNNTIAENTIIRNGLGIWIAEAYGNRIYHNGFIDNAEQIYDGSRDWSHIYDPSVNIWDDGYPSGGNFWSEYNGTDLYNGLYQNITGKDGIGDTPYVIDENNQDNFPLFLPIHNLNTGLYYATIQDAINANETLVGHTIFVPSGTYYENITINKPLSLIAESKDTIITQDYTHYTIEVKANNVTVRGFTIINDRLEYDPPIACLRLKTSSNCNIIDNFFEVHAEGIIVNGGSGNRIVKNEIKDCSSYGISIKYSNSNVIMQNKMNAHISSLELLGSSNNYVFNNFLGIHLASSWCVSLSQSNSNIIEGNRLYVDYFDELSPMELWNSCNNSIFHNNFEGNVGAVWIDAYSKNNTWDNGCEGNYWSNYNGTDLDSDGIGDTELPWEGVDNYPLMNIYWNPADIDHDLDVDLYDAVKLLIAYGSEQGDPEYNPHVDIAEPFGQMDLYDAVLLLANYGKKYS